MWALVPLTPYEHTAARRPLRGTGHGLGSVGTNTRDFSSRSIRGCQVWKFWFGGMAPRRRHSTVLMRAATPEADDDVPGPLSAYYEGMHWDPGPWWSWSHYLSLLGASPNGNGMPVVGGEVTINPPWSSSYEPTLTGCGSSTTTCPANPANFVYLRTSPSSTASLLADPPDTGQLIAYVACTVRGGTAHAASPREVSAVVWAAPDEIHRYVPRGLFPPVQAYLDNR